MSSRNSVPLFEVFPFLQEDISLSGLLDGAEVRDATIDKKNRAMRVTLAFEKLAPPVVLSKVERALIDEFNLLKAEILPVFPEAVKKSPSARAARKKGAGGAAGRAIMGSAEKNPKVRPMSEISLDTGKITVRGRVFNIKNRELKNQNAWVLNFDMTDNTGSVHVSKYLREKGSEDIVSSVKEGMYITVSGSVAFNKYDGDIALEPKNIFISEKPKEREDAAAEKRVELHLHTKMSAMDALCDPKETVARAISWGHRAIAVTDHGVVQSFPDVSAAAGDNIKVIYGIEGDFVNDIDDHLPVYGDISGGIDGEIAVFDIETTGLSATRDRIIEIGAVILKGGTVVDEFHTFAKPGFSIPAEIINLTGIRDSDVRDAPSQKEAVRAFLEFIGDRPTSAHNASFDTGFIYEACRKYSLKYEPRYIDTLALSRILLPYMKSHRLDNVANELALPSFNHHRAVDDARVAGQILLELSKMLKKEGVTDVSRINAHVEPKLAELWGKRRFRHKHIIILARTQAGIKNLYRLVTESHLKYFNRNHPVIPKSLLNRYREGLIVGSACEAGEVFSLVSEGRSRLEQRRIAGFYDYLEIQPISNNSFMLFDGKRRAKSTDDLRDFNRRVVELGEELNIPVVATGDVHFLDPEDEIYRRILLTSKGFADADSELPLYFKTTDEMMSEFSYLGEEKAREVVVKNPNMIADMCENVRPLPQAKKLFAPKIENSAQELHELVHTRMHSLYGDEPPKLIAERVENELRDILDRNYDVIYMSAQKLVADSLKNGYLVGSRGSVGSSIVAYLSGITEVNSLPPHYRCPSCRHTEFNANTSADAGFGCGVDMPDRLCPQCGSAMAKDGFDIPFETFLGFGGKKVPDIDLNFSGEYQANAHKYTTEMFGPEHVFRAGTIGTVKEKTAYGFVKKYLEKHGRVVSKAEENRLLLGCVGVKRTTGQHPGGLVVIPQDMEITDFCPAQYPADDAGTDVITTHFDYHCMEDNLLKLDLLGHDDPTMIKMLEDMTGVKSSGIRLDDRETMEIFRSPLPLGLPEDDEIIGKTGTIGIPEFGTDFTRQMLCDTKPDRFDTLVRLSGFSHGTDVWLGNAKDIILSGTADINETISCRDDIMLYLISLGMDERRAFEIMESVRKGRGLPEGAGGEMAACGVPGWYIDSCQKIKYLFPKAHAVAYVMMAFKIAWYKVHEPLAFYSAYFYRKSQKDSFDAEFMIKGIDVAKAKIREIRNNPEATVKEIDLLITLEACYEFYLRGYEFANIDIYESDAVKFVITGDGKKLRPPFISVGGLGETAARDIVAGRDGKSFISVEDISAACPKLSKTNLEQLQKLGALRGLPETSQMSLF